MNVIISNSYNPYFNIASEEYLLKQSIDDVFLIYRNEPSIIIGKHQNALKEINYSYVKQNNIGLVRRITGGGTVYHDLGNINYTFIVGTETGSQVDFKKYTSPVLKLLKRLNINAKFVGKSDLFVDGKKFSGNAAHVFKEKVIHHGTVLFSSDLNKLENALKTDINRFKDKAVESKRSTVTNIIDHLNEDLGVERFMDQLITRVTIDFNTVLERSFTNDETIKIEELVKKKYSTWKWNFGYSPLYQMDIKINNISYNLVVENGNIVKFQCSEPDGVDNDLVIISDIIKDKPHHEGQLIEVLKKEYNKPKAAGLDIERFVELLF